MTEGVLMIVVQGTRNPLFFYLSVWYYDVYAACIYKKQNKYVCWDTDAFCTVLLCVGCSIENIPIWVAYILGYINKIDT